MSAQVGLELLLRDGRVFECHKSISDAVYNAELGASLAIFRAGYTIDSLMLRYQGIDWTDTRNWECNARCDSWQANFFYTALFQNVC